MEDSNPVLLGTLDTVISVLTFLLWQAWEERGAGQSSGRRGYSKALPGLHAGWRLHRPHALWLSGFKVEGTWRLHRRGRSAWFTVVLAHAGEDEDEDIEDEEDEDEGEDYMD